MFSQEWKKFTDQRLQLQKIIETAKLAVDSFPYLQEDITLSRQYQTYTQIMESLCNDATALGEKLLLQILPETINYVMEDTSDDEMPPEYQGLSDPEFVEKLARMVDSLAGKNIKPDIQTIKKVMIPTFYCQSVILPNLHQKFHDEFKACKQTRRQELVIAKANLDQHLQQELAWATADIEHLRFFISNCPARAQQARKAFKKRHPHTELPNDLAPPLANQKHTPRTPVLSKKQKRRQKNKSKERSPQVESSPTQPWLFIAINETTKSESTLSQDTQIAHNQLREYITSQPTLRSLDPRLVWNKLLHFTRLSRQDRQHIKQLTHDEPVGWKNPKLNQDFRIIMDINEDQHLIQFMIRPRKEAY